MTEKSYKCAMCGEEYLYGWTEEEALAELNSTFPKYSADECELVCDDCYPKITAAIPPSVFVAENPR